MRTRYITISVICICFYIFLIFPACLPAGLSGKTEEYTIKEYLQKAAINHPEQKLNSYNPLGAEASYHERKYSYSPQINAGYSHVANNAESAGSYPLKNDRYTIGVSKLFALTGTQLGLNFVNNHTVMDISFSSGLGGGGIPGTGGSSFGFGLGNYDSWNSAYEISIVQPLLRNGPIGIPGKKQIDLLKESVRLNRSIHNLRLEGIIFSSLSLYWKLRLNKKNLELTADSLRDSREMLEKNRRRVELGTVDIVEVYDFEAAYVRAQAEYNNSKKEYQDLKKEFLYTLGAEEIQTNEVDLKLKDELKVEQSVINREKIYQQARNNRRDLEQARLQKKMTELTLDIAKVTMLPRLDLSLTGIFQGYDDNQSDLLKAIKDTEFNKNKLDFTVGLQFQMPIDLRALKVVKERAQVNYNRAGERLVQLDYSIKKELDKLIRTVEYYRETEKAYAKTVTLMGKKLKEYKKKYYNGKIDSNLYVRSQDDLRNWQKIHLATLFSYKLAEAQLQVAQGIFLKKYGISELDVHGNVN